MAKETSKNVFKAPGFIPMRSNTISCQGLHSGGGAGGLTLSEALILARDFLLLAEERKP